MQNAKCNMQNAKCKIQNAKCKMQNAKYKIQNTKYKIQNTKYKVYLKISSTIFANLARFFRILTFSHVCPVLIQYWSIKKTREKLSLF